MVNIDNINFNKLIDENNDTVIKIFEYVKLHKWNDIIQLIENSNIDLNIKDNSNTYLLEYAVIFNQIDLIKILIKKDVRIDIIDESSRSILYNIIKFSYIETLIIILEKDKISIGKSILELKDKEGNIPLFYAIKFFNIESVKIILKYTSNFYIKNSEGDNALHIAIKSQNIDLFNIIIHWINDFKSRNNIGETYLHLIIKFKCYNMLETFIKKYHDEPLFIQMLNNVEYKFNFTILHYIAIGIDYTSLEILFNYNLLKLLDGNIQDNSGNIFYHYFINNIINVSKLSVELINNIINMNELIKNINFNINLYNIDGNTPAHIFFSNINFFSNNKLNILINWISEKVNLNIQNFIGESVFYLIVKNKFWKQIFNILINKKIDIFIISENSNTVFDYIEQKDYDEFIKMITQSYIYQLRHVDSSIKWIDYWDNRCKKNVKLSELNETELELLKSLSIDINNTNTNICEKIIENKLIKSINLFIENKNFIDLTSYPVSTKFVKLILNYPNVIISTFSGSTIDVLCGLIYLSDKFNISKKNVQTSILFFKNSNSIIECSIQTQNIFTDNKKSKLENKICEINGFEILWINKNIFFPSNKNLNIQKILNFICKNVNEGIKWFIVPIGIEINSYSHANYLIFDIEKKQVERFEPHGAFPPIGLNYDAELLDTILIENINSYNLGFEYFAPKDYLPKIGFQIKEINELKNDYIGDPNGFCALWCIWWADIRISNPDISRNKLVSLLHKELINSKYSYRKLIRDYSQYIIDIRDRLFIKSNTNINEWINDTIPDKNIELLNIAIKESIIQNFIEIK